MTDITPALLSRYNVQGPRYTSYPPAPSWTTDVGAEAYDSILQESSQAHPQRPLSVYLHLPFCEKLCYFCGCTTFITGKNRNYEQPYLEALKKEIEWVAARLPRDRKVIQFHLGGGTPTFHSPDQLKSLMRLCQDKFSFEAEAEVGIEVDPRVTTSDHLQALKEVGFNRLSMGVQDFNDTVQKAINRIQPYEDTRVLVDQARGLGFVSVNMDLIYGLPYQTVDSFSHTLSQILTIAPDRLAVYSYAHVPWLKTHQDLLKDHLPTQEEKYQIFIQALHTFTQAGFEYIGMDHFAKPDDELSVARKNRTLWRNFMGYTTKAGTDLLGLGMSAIGHINDSFVQNHRDMKTYQEAWLHGGPAVFRGFRLSREDRLRSRVIQNLLCHAVVVKADIEKEFDTHFDGYFRKELDQLREMEKDQLVVLKKDRIEPTELGRIFLRNLAMPFDAYLPKSGETRVFSRTV